MTNTVKKLINREQQANYNQIEFVKLNVQRYHIREKSSNNTSGMKTYHRKFHDIATVRTGRSKIIHFGNLETFYYNNNLYFSKNKENIFTK